MTDEIANSIELGENILNDKVEEFKLEHPFFLAELDYSLFLHALERVNEDSPVKIARNALNEKREWISGTEVHNVGKVFLSDDHCLVFVLSHSENVMTVSQLLDTLFELNKQIRLDSFPLMIQINEKTRIEATDLFAHSLVTSMWAGLPLDVVLCYVQEKPKKAQLAETQESTSEDTQEITPKESE